MKITGLGLIAGLAVALALPCLSQDAPAATTEASSLIVGHPFTAIKYARQFKVLPGGKLQFLRNDHYPVRIARDADGRLMMQVLKTDPENPECHWLDTLVPPVCPSWHIFVIDPVANKVTHWIEGELGNHGAVDFPLTQARLQDAVDSTTALPSLKPDFTDEDGKMSTADLGDRTIDGLAAHGTRWTLLYDVNQDGQAVERTRIHEVWTSQQMQLIVRVIDGDPYGEETIWGLEKISLNPDPALFRPPDDYQMEHRKSDGLAETHHGFVDEDFEALQEWFAQ